MLNRVIYYYENEKLEPIYHWLINYENGFVTELKIYGDKLNNDPLWQQEVGKKWKGNFPVF